MEKYCILISKDENEYENMLYGDPPCYEEIMIRDYLSKKFEYKKKFLLICINGYKLKNTNKEFYDFFLNNNNKGINEEKLISFLNDVIHDCENILDDRKTSKFTKNNSLLAFHWGGNKGILANKKLNSSIKKLGNKFPVLITYFSSYDNPYYSNIINKTNDKIKEIVKDNVLDSILFYFSRALGYKNKIYELKENILINKFPEFIKHEKNIEICEKTIINDTKWLLKDLKKELLKNESIDKQQVERVYEDGFEKCVKIDREKVKITSVKEIRVLFNNLLNLLPGNIYPKPL